MVLPMTSYQEKYNMSMELRGFAENTKKLYLEHLERFIKFSRKSPEACDYDDVRSFLLNAIKVRKLSHSYINSAYSAIKFYFETTLCREWNMKHIPRLKSRSFLPEILTREEVNQILAATDNLKHKAILTVIYSAGLRVNEAVHLKIADIDSPNMRIHIRQGKGFKDRNSILSEITLFLLRDYYRKYRPKEWLFPGIDPTKPLHARTPQVVFHESVKRVGITKKVSIHSLRHAFATHLLNQETPLLMIQELLGHADINTTAKYIHLTNAQVRGVKSPLDHPEGNPND